MGVVETRCSAFENEFKHTEARVTEVSGSVNFGDKFHEVHFGSRTRMCARMRDRSVYLVLQRIAKLRNKFEWESPFRFVAFDSMSRSIEITSSFQAQIRSLVACGTRSEYTGCGIL